MKHTDASHIAALLRQLHGDSLMTLIERIRTQAAGIAQSAAPDFELEPAIVRAGVELRSAIRIADVDLTKANDAVVLLSLCVGREGRSGRTVAKTRKVAQIAPRLLAAVNILRICVDIQERGQLEDWHRDGLILAISGLDRIDRGKGGRTSRAKLAEGLPVRIKSIADAKFAAGYERHELTGVIAPMVRRSTSTVRRYLNRLGYLKTKKKRAQT